MNDEIVRRRSEGSLDARAYEPPAFEVIPLDCEITAYAPDGEPPLF